MSKSDIAGYTYAHADYGHHHAYLLPTIASQLAALNVSPKKVFDLGCGNGVVANWISNQGYEVAGVDPSETGIREANKAFPSLNLQVGSAYDRLHEAFGTFPLLISLEVVEHVYAPRDYAKCISSLLAPNGYALISTPYHGYMKNLALAITGKMDSHFTALWDHGHIKFWSPNTITQLLSEANLVVRKILRVGRVPCLAKSMIVVAQKTG